jgi:beta-N-acetylhexosaminidase
MAHPAAIILSCEGHHLTDAEKRLFASANPLGFILFARNCDNPDQIRALNHELRDCVGWHCPILIDQEGGRVQRLKPPHWQQFMPAQSCNSTEDAAGIASYIAADLAALNIDVNCSPVMDLLCEETHDIIGDRAFSDNPQEVLEKGEAVCNAYLEAGITPIMKHIPGHGRANSDSHLELPIVDTPLDELERTDFEPFRRLAKAQNAPQVWGMVAHVVYSALDSEMAATVSKTVMNYVREEMGVDQFLLADDISMLALEKYGNLADRAVKTLESGCDATLYCAGNLTEMEFVMRDVPPMTKEAYRRYDRSRIRRRSAA